VVTATAVEFEALGFDPAPGDAAGVDELAERYRRISTKLGSAAEALATIGSRAGLWQGDAAEAFFDDTRRLPDYLDRAVESTSSASSALADWATALADMQGRAYELELKARKATAEAEAARDDPALDLAWQSFTDPGSLGAAQQLLDAAAARLHEAIDNLEAIREAAERLLDEHTETAEGIAERLEQARELAPDQPRGGLGGVVDDIGGALDNVRDDVSGFLEDNANLLAATSRIVGDVSMVVGMAGDLPIPVVGEVLSATATGMDAAALGGLMVADHYGADVPDSEIQLGVIGLGASAAGIIPGVPSTLVESAAAVGYGLDGADAAEHFVPQNDRQWAQHGLSLVLGRNPVPSLAVGLENMTGDWGDQISDAQDADRAAREERE
jgi:hypothetical protein